MHAVLARFGLGDPVWLDPAISAAIVLLALAVAVAYHQLLVPIALRFTHWTPSDLDTRLLRATRWPVNLGLVTVGVYLAVTLPLDLTAGQKDLADAVARAIGIIVAIAVVVAVVSNASDWYLENLAARANNFLDLRLFPPLRRVVVVVIYGLGLFLVLDVFGINPNPLIAGLGLGGLAVALALQPTLANLFAGTYVMTEGVITTGDYIELEHGVAGYVVSVGWRSTRIRTWRNNLVVIPNARFAETIFTNYHEPVPAVNVYLTCGVSYSSDLDQVELASREVMDQVIQEDVNAVTDYGSWFAFDGFGESNVNFWLFVQARDRLASFSLQSRLVKDLHRRFRDEGIVINYPVRSLQFPDGWGPQDTGMAATVGRSGAPAARRPSVSPDGNTSEADATRVADVDGDAAEAADGDGGPG